MSNNDDELDDLIDTLEGSNDVDYKFKPGQSGNPHKSCRVCGVVRSVNMFYRNSSAKDGLDSRCRSCEKTRRKNAYHNQYELETFNRFRHRCRLRGIKFELSLADIPKVPSHCPVLGIELSINWGGKAQSSSSPTLDKINPELGYIRGNVVWMSNEANRMKSNHTIESLENLLGWMKRNLR